MRILLWHGYLLGGTGSNVYTRSLAREWSRAGHDVTVFAQEPHPEEYDLGGASVVRPDIGGLLPTFVLDEYEGHGGAARAGPDRGRARALRGGERRSAPSASAGRPRVREPRRARRARRGRDRSEVRRSRRTARSSSTRCAGTRSCRGGGGSRSSDAEAVFVGSEHIRRVLDEVVGHVDRVHVVPPGVDIDEFVPLPRDEALRDLIAESRADPPNPDNANERLPDEGNAERLEAFLADDEPTVLYFGKLLLQQGRARALRSSARRRRESRRRRLRRLPRGARANGAAAHALHRAAGAPAPREADPAHRRDRRAVDLPRGVRHGRGRGGRRRIAPSRREPLRPRGDRRRASRPSIRSRTAT